MPLAMSCTRGSGEDYKVRSCTLSPYFVVFKPYDVNDLTLYFKVVHVAA